MYARCMCFVCLVLVCVCTQMSSLSLRPIFTDSHFTFFKHAVIT